MFFANAHHGALFVSVDILYYDIEMFVTIFKVIYIVLHYFYYIRDTHVYT